MSTTCVGAPSNVDARGNCPLCPPKSGTGWISHCDTLDLCIQLPNTSPLVRNQESTVSKSTLEQIVRTISSAAVGGVNLSATHSGY